MPPLTSEELSSCVVPTLETPIEPDRDLVWCASLDLAWRELGTILGTPIAVNDGGRGAALVRMLNASTVEPADVDPESCVALAGWHTAEWVRRAEELVRQRLPGLESRRLPREPDPELFVAYAVLAKSWMFPVPFQRMHGWLSFRGTRVDSFSLGSPFAQGDDYERRAEQALVHYHRFLEISDEEDEDAEDQEEFVLELLTDRPDDCLILARVAARPPTLAAAVEWAVARMRSDVAADPGSRLRRDEKLQVPVIEFDHLRIYDELYAVAVANQGYERHRFGVVGERIRFRLDEGGASLVSESDFRGLSLPPRSILFDAPFLFMALRRGRPRPFLALWIETPNLLLR